MDNPSEEVLALLVDCLLRASNKKFTTLVEKVQDVYLAKEKQATKIKVEIALNDLQSRNFQTLQLLGEFGNLKGIKPVNTIFYDGLALNTQYFLKALEVAMRMKQDENSKDD